MPFLTVCLAPHLLRSMLCRESDRGGACGNINSSLLSQDLSLFWPLPVFLVAAQQSLDVYNTLQGKLQQQRQADSG